jgi:hypothetical protein
MGHVFSSMDHADNGFNLMCAPPPRRTWHTSHLVFLSTRMHVVQYRPTRTLLRVDNVGFAVLS